MRVLSGHVCVGVGVYVTHAPQTQPNPTQPNPTQPKRTLHEMLSSWSASAISSLVSTLVVPTKMGCPVLCARRVSLSMARSFPSLDRKTASG